MQQLYHAFTKVSQLDPTHLDFLAQVATWYYEDGFDQEAIAQRISRSRSMVSRLLEEARRAGLVEIRVHYPLKTDGEKERQLEQAFGLRHAIVLAEPPADYEMLLRRLGELGARYLASCLHPGITIGVGSGTGVYAMVRAMPEMPVANASVIQFVGTIGHGDPMIDGAELARWLAQKLDATFHYLSAPLLVENESVAQSLLQERSIAGILEQAAQAEIALVGVGSIKANLSSLTRAGYVGPEELAELERLGAVGDIVARHLDAGGRILDVPINRRVIAFPDLDILHQIPQVIAVAGSLAKVPAILAILRGRYLKVLVTDAVAAGALLATN